MSPADTLPPLDLGLLDLGALTDFALPDLTLSLPISPDSPEDHGAFSLDTPPTENPPAIMSTQSLSATPVLGRERSSSLPGYASPATVTFAFPPTPAHIASTLPSPGHSQSTFEFPATPPNMKCESPLPVPLHPFANSSALFRSISPISFGLSVNGNELSPVPQPVIQLSAEKELPPIPLPLDVSDELDELTSTIGSDSYGSAESDALEVVLDIDCDRLLPTVRMSTSAPRDRRKHRPMITTKQPMVHIQEPTPSDESPSAEENAAKRGFRGTLPAALAAPPSSPTTPASPGASKSLRRMSKRQSYISAAPQSPEELLSQAQIRVLERTAESLNPPPPVEMTSGPALAGVFSPPPHMSSSTTESFGDSLILAVPGTPPSLPLSAILPSFPKTPTTPNSLPPSTGLWYRTNSSAAPSPGSGKSIFGPLAVWTPPKPHSKTLPSHPPPNVALPPTPPSAIAALPNLWPPMSASFPQSPAQRAHGTTPSPSRAPSPFQRAPSPLQCAPSPLQRARSPLSQIASPAQRPSSLSPMPSCYSSPLLPPSPLLTNTLPPASVVAVDFFRLLAQEKEQLLDERQKLKRATLETERAREVPDSLKAELQKMRIELERVRKEAGTLRAGRQLAEGEVQHLRAEVQAMRGEVEKAKLEAGRVRFEGSGLAAADARAMEENARVLARVGAERDAAVRDAERAWRDKELLARECERLRVERRKLLDEGRDAKRGLELADEKVRWLMKSGETLRVEMDMLGRENALLQRELGARAREREQEQKWMASAAGVPMNA